MQEYLKVASFYRGYQFSVHRFQKKNVGLTA
jgi:hypothetical protein